MKKLSFLTAAVLFLFSTSVFAKIGQRNLEEDVKLRRVCIPHVTIAVPGIDTTVGHGGLIGTKTASGATSITLSEGTLELSSFAYPSAVNVILHDASSDGVLACSAVVITGEDQFGRGVRETVAASETAAETTTVWSKISSVSATGCENGATSDTLNIYQSLTIGLGVKIARASDVESVCLDDGGSEIKCVSYDDGTALDISSKADPATDSYDLSGAQFGTGSKASVADADGVCFSVRSSKN